jgi:hypothetical protein
MPKARYLMLNRLTTSARYAGSRYEIAIPKAGKLYQFDQATLTVCEVAEMYIEI